MPGPKGPLEASVQQTIDEARQDDNVKWAIDAAAQKLHARWAARQPKRLQQMREALDIKQRLRMFADPDCWLTLGGLDDDD